MSADEFQDHYEDFCAQPWGDWTVTLMLAQLSALLANINRDAKARPRPYEVNDFLPGEAAREQSAPKAATDEISELQAFLRGMT